jgi:phage shock protein PspC (stress-responsive transcriptional regulator)
VLGSILGLGQSPSSFGVTLALILAFVVVVGGVVNFVVGYIIAQVIKERSENLKRRRDYDALHKQP